MELLQHFRQQQNPDGYQTSTMKMKEKEETEFLFYLKSFLLTDKYETDC